MVNNHKLAMDKYINSDKGKATRRKYIRDMRERLRREALSLLGNKCVKCGIADYRVLQIDHIVPCGSVERKKMSAYTYYNQIVDEIKRGKHNYQCLCANCNWIKRYDNREDKIKQLVG